MIKFLVTCLVILTSVVGSTASAETSPFGPSRYDWLSQLLGDWILLPTGSQVPAKPARNDPDDPGGRPVALRYRLTPDGSALQASLFPGTCEESKTIYGCEQNDCHRLKAIHHPPEQNQPILLADPMVLRNRLVFRCDMRTTLCRSGAEHIHFMSLEISENGQRGQGGLGTRSE